MTAPTADPGRSGPGSSGQPQPEVSGRWLASPAMFGAAAMALVLLLAGTVAHRPAAVVLAVPLLGYVLYALATRPAARPGLSAGLGVQTLTEGESSDTELTLTAPGAAAVATWQRPTAYLAQHPPGGAALVPVTDGSATTAVGVGVKRWGLHEIAPVRVAVSAPLGAWRWPLLSTPSARIRGLPSRVDFTAVSAAPQPEGMVGAHHSRRTGDNGELDQVRAFRAGDRLRRINWRVSSRTDQLQVNATWSERDTDVQLAIDTSSDVGWSEGLGGAASSLDLTIRACSSIAAHYLRTGDRVSVVDLGGHGRDVRPGAGRGHLRRIDDTLVYAGVDRETGYVPGRHLLPGTLTIVLSPVLTEVATSFLASVIQRGRTAIVVDTLPDYLTDAARYPAAGDPKQHGEAARRALAWQLRVVERDLDLDAIRALGVPVVPWRGPGTLDEVLRVVSRPAPRMAARRITP